MNALWKEPTPSPEAAPITATGQPWYYVARFQDYLRRHASISSKVFSWADWEAASPAISLQGGPCYYYLFFGPLMNVRFWRSRHRLSRGGEDWVAWAGRSLQERIEQRREADPVDFAQLENNRPAFEDA